MVTTTKRRNGASLQGLEHAAMGPNVEDPLGTNLKRRGLDAYYEEARQSDPRFASGPLPDPQWAGLFQALADQGVTRVGMDAGRPHGIADNPEWAMSGDVGALTDSGIPHQALMKSTNIAGQQPLTASSYVMENLTPGAVQGGPATSLAKLSANKKKKVL